MKPDSGSCRGNVFQGGVLGDNCLPDGLRGPLSVTRYINTRNLFFPSSLSFNPPLQPILNQPKRIQTLLAPSYQPASAPFMFSNSLCSAHNSHRYVSFLFPINAISSARSTRTDSSQRRQTHRRLAAYSRLLITFTKAPSSLYQFLSAMSPTAINVPGHHDSFALPITESHQAPVHASARRAPEGGLIKVQGDDVSYEAEGVRAKFTDRGANVTSEFPTHVSF